MGMVAAQQRIASAYFVVFGNYGDVSRYAQERGVCRQWVYREAGWVHKHLQETQQENQRLRQQVQELWQRLADMEKRLAMAVVLDKEKQEEFASVGQAHGVSLPICWNLLDVLIPGQQESVATLGRATKAAGEKAGQVLAVLDVLAQERLRDAAGDEIYVNDPVLMVVEQESLCWMTGRLSAEVSGEAWAREFRHFPNLEQVARDGGKGLEKGVALVNAERQAQDKPLVVDQGDHWHALRGGSVGLRQAERQAREALAKAEEADQELAACDRQGHKRTGPAVRASAAWRKAEQAMDIWCERERLWQKTKEALRLFTPEGQLNTRQQAEAVLAQTLPQLPDAFAKAKRHLHKPEMLNYLDQVQRQLEALPFPQEVKQAAVRQEGLRRRPELLKGEGVQAAAFRGVLLACAVVLAKAEEVGQKTQAAVRDIIRRAYRASSLVECINSVLRMQQARHRKMTQSLLDLKRLHWNCHTFHTGRRRKTTPYQRLGLPWPEGLRWWDVLKLTPEQLREKLSTVKNAK
jgi:cell division septum initiation protein DivIVA